MTSKASLRQRRKSSASSKTTAQSKTTKTPPKSPSKPSIPTSHSSIPTPLSTHFTLLDLLLTLILFSFAFLVRVYRLASISQVIFDEVHYLNFTNFLLRREYFFDVNPVFGKLLIALVSHLLGYQPGPVHKALGEPLSISQAFAARMPAVIFGALTVPVFYRVCRLLRLSVWASFLGGTFILLDCMHVIQSRIAMVDSVLVFFCCAAFYAALLLWDAKNVVVIKGKNVTIWDAVKVLVLLTTCGVLCGLSVSVRWTAFATPMLIFIVSMFGVAPFCREALNIIELAVLYGSAIMAYVGSFMAFLWRANTTGTGDGFMSEEFQKCIKGNANWVGDAGCKMGMLKRVWEVNKVIFRYSKGIRGNDKWGSSWFQWILNWKGALYFRENVGNQGDIGYIYILMNPVMSMGINVLMLVFVMMVFYQVRYRKALKSSEALKMHLRRGGALFFGWMGSMLPTMVVYRSGPMYQYLPGLFFAQALGAVGFDLFPRKVRPLVGILLIMGMIGAFGYWSPWVYGDGLPMEKHIERRWISTWD